MKILALLVSSYFSGVAISQGAVVQVPVRLSPFGGSQTIAIVDNAGSVISVGVQRRCTRDFPGSFCSTSSVISGGAKVEFLRSGVNTLARLASGDILSSTPDAGVWGTNLLNRFESQISTSSFADGQFSSETAAFFYGFRVETGEGEYHYGWLEVGSQNGQASVVRSANFSDSSIDSLTIQSIPEPSAVLLILGALGIFTTRVRSSS